MELGNSGRKAYDVACHLTEVLKWLRQVQKDQHDLDFSATNSKVIAAILANHILAAMDLLEIARTACLEVLTPPNFLETSARRRERRLAVGNERNADHSCTTGESIARLYQRIVGGAGDNRMFHDKPGGR